jgi:hypothetical protein
MLMQYVAEGSVPRCSALFQSLEQAKPLVRLRFGGFLCVCSIVPYIYPPLPKPEELVYNVNHDGFVNQRGLRQVV